MKPESGKATATLVVSMLVFGTIGIFRRYIPLPSAFLAFARGMLGGLYLFVFTRIRNRGKHEKIEKKNLILLIVSGAFIGFNWMFLFEAYNYTTVAVATLCYYMQPTIVMVLSPVFFREKLTGKKALCAVVAVLGMVLVSGVLESSRNTDIRGVLFGLGAAVLYASVVMINKKIVGVDAYEKTMVQLLSAGSVMIPYLLLTSGFTGGVFTVSSVVLLLVVGIFHTGIAYVMYFGSMEALPVQTVAILSYIDPVSATLFSALLLKEEMSLLSAVGAVMIIGSAIVSELRPSLRKD
ncbi:MAG: DMT family transporter [Sphaerochaetaceae bacterium]|nr:DMT family transporter [Sphaerochaetaceae bacterium]